MPDESQARAILDGTNQTAPGSRKRQRKGTMLVPIVGVLVLSTCVTRGVGGLPLAEAWNTYSPFQHSQHPSNQRAGPKSPHAGTPVRAVNTNAKSNTNSNSNSNSTSTTEAPPSTTPKIRYMSKQFRNHGQTFTYSEADELQSDLKGKERFSTKHLFGNRMIREPSHLDQFTDYTLYKPANNNQKDQDQTSKFENLAPRRDAPQVPTLQHYKVLGVSSDATKDEIKAAFRKLARLYHPDRKTDDTSDATTLPTKKTNPAMDRIVQFSHLTRAYEILSNPITRQRYDAHGRKALGTSAASDELKGEMFPVDLKVSKKDTEDEEEEEEEDFATRQQQIQEQQPEEVNVFGEASLFSQTMYVVQTPERPVQEEEEDEDWEDVEESFWNEDGILVAAFKDFYDVLVIAKDATMEEIDESYELLSRIYNPKHNKDLQSIERYEEIQRAYEILSDPSAKAKYDAKGILGIERPVEKESLTITESLATRLSAGMTDTFTTFEYPPDEIPDYYIYSAQEDAAARRRRRRRRKKNRPTIKSKQSEKDSFDNLSSIGSMTIRAPPTSEIIKPSSYMAPPPGYARATTTTTVPEFEGDEIEAFTTPDLWEGDDGEVEYIENDASDLMVPKFATIAPLPIGDATATNSEANEMVVPSKKGTKNPAAIPSQRAKDSSPASGNNVSTSPSSKQKTVVTKRYPVKVPTIAPIPIKDVSTTTMQTGLGAMAPRAEADSKKKSANEGQLESPSGGSNGPTVSKKKVYPVKVPTIAPVPLKDVSQATMTTGTVAQSTTKEPKESKKATLKAQTKMGKSQTAPVESRGVKKAETKTTPIAPKAADAVTSEGSEKKKTKIYPKKVPTIAPIPIKDVTLSSSAYGGGESKTKASRNTMTQEKRNAAASTFFPLPATPNQAMNSNKQLNGSKQSVNPSQSSASSPADTRSVPSKSHMPKMAPSTPESASPEQKRAKPMKKSPSPEQKWAKSMKSSTSSKQASSPAALSPPDPRQVEMMNSAQAAKSSSPTKGATSAPPPEELVQSSQESLGSPPDPSAVPKIVSGALSDLNASTKKAGVDVANVPTNKTSRSPVQKEKSVTLSQVEKALALKSNRQDTEKPVAKEESFSKMELAIKAAWAKKQEKAKESSKATDSIKSEKSKTDELSGTPIKAELSGSRGPEKSAPSQAMRPNVEPTKLDIKFHPSIESATESNEQKAEKKASAAKVPLTESDEKTTNLQENVQKRVPTAKVPVTESDAKTTNVQEKVQKKVPTAKKPAQSQRAVKKTIRKLARNVITIKPLPLKHEKRSEGAVTAAAVAASAAAQAVTQSQSSLFSEAVTSVSLPKRNKV